METHYEQPTIITIRRQECSALHIESTLHTSVSTITRKLKRFTAWKDRPAFVPVPECAYDVRAAGAQEL